MDTREIKKELRAISEKDTALNNNDALEIEALAWEIRNQKGKR